MSNLWKAYFWPVYPEQLSDAGRCALEADRKASWLGNSHAHWNRLDVTTMVADKAILTRNREWLFRHAHVFAERWSVVTFLIWAAGWAARGTVPGAFLFLTGAGTGVVSLAFFAYKAAFRHPADK